MAIKFYFGLLLCFFSTLSHGKIQIVKWNQQTSFNEDGRIIQLTISSEVNGIKQNQYYDKWTYNFPKSQDITILETSMGETNFTSKFKENSLKFKFPPTKNGGKLTFQVSYIVNKRNDDQYVRHEYISAPSFAAGAQGSLRVTYPRDFTHYSRHKDFISCGKSCLKWKGTIPQDGISESLDLTAREMLFKTSITDEYSSQDKLSSLKVTLPNYFEFGPDTIKSLNMYSSIQGERTKTNEEINYH
ncbi:MAG: hypothetical protein HRU09_15710 [Oligoflexales bacterium]|nr:hypothetical protein [Oligoflexales bacterium]